MYVSIYGVEMIDPDGYPTDETLKRIRTFDPFKGDLDEFIDYIVSNWVNGYPAEYDPKNYVLKLSTGGWSGCESIIDALKQNHTFWTLFWYSSARGGHYEFRGLVDRREKK